MVHNKKAEHYCRVCGLDWEESRDVMWQSSYCPCCGVQVGYQDSLSSSAKRFRQQWIEKGAHWDMPEHQPKDWNLEEQLANIPEEFR